MSLSKELLEGLEQGEVRNTFKSKRLTIGMDAEFTTIIIFADGDPIGTISTDKMQYNEYEFADGNKNRSLQYLQMAKGKKGVPFFLVDPETGEELSDKKIGTAMLKIEVDNSHAMGVIATDNNIDLKVK